MADLHCCAFSLTLLSMYNIFNSTKKLFIISFWGILFLSVWAQNISMTMPFLWLIPSAIVIFFSIVISHFLSDVILPRALVSARMKHFFILASLLTFLLAVIMAIVFTFFPIFLNDPNTFIRESVSTWYELFGIRLLGGIPSAMTIVTTMCGIRFYQEHTAIEKVHTQLKQDHLEAQLKLLQDQINPHLMFNVLNHIHILMQKNIELASTLLLKFSDILRYQLYECNHKMVLLNREIQYLQDFVDIEQIRWGNELEVNCTWTIPNKQLHIAPLMLVPLIENAFKHVSRLPHTKGFITIRCIEENNVLKLDIVNSFSSKFHSIKQKGGIGIANVKERLAMQYPDKHQLSLIQDENTFSAHLSINLQ